MAKKINKPGNGSPEVKPEPAKKTVKSKAPRVEEKPSPAKPKVTRTKKIGTEVGTNHLKPVEPYSRFTDFDIALFKSGKHYKLYEKFGSHVIEFNGVIGTYFAVWPQNPQYIPLFRVLKGGNRGS